ncbi:hypothetical protein [Nonomuraea glycinis]|uniref:hypothetical protein n=1 Tax=Nonomuraea glycinis TaxID=2047744 RepID=UPI0033AED4CB
MNTYYVKTGPGQYDVETVHAARVREAGGFVRFVLSNGEVVRSVPAGTRICTIEVSEDTNPVRTWL